MSVTNTKMGISYKELSDAYFNLQKKYYELIMAVETVYISETRHETALRYIQEAENKAIGEKQ